MFFFPNKKPTGICFPNPEMGHLNKLDLFFCYCLLSTMVKHHTIKPPFERISLTIIPSIFSSKSQIFKLTGFSLEKNRIKKKPPKIWATTSQPPLNCLSPEMLKIPPSSKIWSPPEPRLEWWPAPRRLLSRHGRRSTGTSAPCRPTYRGNGLRCAGGGKDGWCPIRIRKKTSSF